MRSDLDDISVTINLQYINSEVNTAYYITIPVITVNCVTLFSNFISEKFII